MLIHSVEVAIQDSSPAVKQTHYSTVINVANKNVGQSDQKQHPSIN